MFLELSVYTLVIGVILGIVAMLFNRWEIVLTLCPAIGSQIAVFWALSAGDGLGYLFAAAFQFLALRLYWSILSWLFPDIFKV